MSDALSFVEIDGQQVELLPARTVLSTGGYSSDDTAAATNVSYVVNIGGYQEAYVSQEADASADDVYTSGY